VEKVGRDLCWLKENVKFTLEQTMKTYIVQEAEWGPWLVWTGEENLAALGFDPQTVHPVVSHYANYPELIGIAAFISWI
jgi:hypothetical protein